MRILLVSEDIPYPNMGGLAKHVLALAHALIRAGHQVDLLGGNQHSIEVAGDEGRFIEQSGGRFFGELSGHVAGWKEIRLGMFLPPRRTWVARRFARIILRHARDYDVIHYHGHVANVALYIPGRVNFVQTFHDQGSECLMRTRFRDDNVCTSIDPSDCAGCRTSHPNALQRKVSALAVTRYRNEVAAGIRRHKTIFVSDMLRRNFARQLGPGPWGTVVHNFINVEQVRQALRSAAAAFRRDGFHVFVAGKLYPAKGIEAFLREFVPRMPRHVRLSIAGDGGDEARLRQEFEGGQVRFLGWCTHEQTMRHAAHADAIVVPSLLEEAFGFTTLEGLLLGKPVFALNRGGTPELAAYAAAPGQLRLQPDMPSLVTDLLDYDPAHRFPLPNPAPACADHAVQLLLEIYRLPPGQLADQFSTSHPKHSWHSHSPSSPAPGTALPISTRPYPRS